MLESVTTQTLVDIEIICVDDGSTDDTFPTLQAWAARDARITVIRHEESQSSSQARKDGVAASTGAYLMFLDADDELAPNACERALAAIEEQDVDMVQFGTEVIPAPSVTAGRVRNLEKYLTPYLERLNNTDLVVANWEQRLFSHTLWNKIYRGDLCRQAFALVEDGSFTRAQDIYAFFFIASLSTSYAGIPDELYRYHFGEGMDGKDFYTLDEYRRYLGMKRVSDALARYIDQDAAHENHATVVESMRNEFLHQAVVNWKSRLSAGSAEEGFGLLVDTWGYEDVMCSLAQSSWYARSSVAKRLIGHPRLRCNTIPEGRTTTIAYYSHCIANGDAQRVAAELCNLWAAATNDAGEARYRVVLITDEGPTDEDYPLDERVIRRYLPDRETATRANYRERFRAWMSILDEDSIDVVVHGRCLDACLFWDMLTVKGHASHPAFILHCHNCVISPYKWTIGETPLANRFFYELADGVAALSDADKTFVECFNHNVACIPNPFGYPQSAAPPKAALPREDHTIVWAGRISPEKQPLDLVHMMRHVVERVPDAKLYLVGSGDEALTARIEETTQQLGLEEHIELVGACADPTPWYRRAAVFIMTSASEGFSMTVGEALSCATPVVMYDLPWLAWVRDGRGIRTVEQGQRRLLADEVANLLENPAEARRLGELGRQHFEDVAGVDKIALWQGLFDGIDPDRAPAQKSSDEAILFECITEWTNNTRQSLVHSRDDARTRANKLQDQLKKAQEVPLLAQGVMARIDVLNLGADDNAVECVEVSDPLVRKSNMSWAKGGGHGNSFTSGAGQIEIVVRCVGAGTLEIKLRGLDIRDDDGKRIPVWVDYTRFEIDGESILTQHRAICHDKNFGVKRPVEDGQLVTIAASWRHCAEARNDELAGQLAACEGELANCENELASCTDELASCAEELKAQHDWAQRAQSRSEELERQRASAEGELARVRAESESQRAQSQRREKELSAKLAKSESELTRVRASTTWKVGRVVTWPFRAAKRLVKRMRGAK